MTLIDRTEDVERYVEGLKGQDYVAVDTEFMRDKTYYPQLCLLQLAGTQGAVAIDTLADGIDLSAIDRLMADNDILKVLHAPRQDLEIFVHRNGTVPGPIFDTQLAAMVLGFGEEVGYETLVREVAKAQLDKTSRFTDWSRRPLSAKQLDYALGDVIHLRTVYERFIADLVERGRSDWVDEELSALGSADLYTTKPDEAWRRLKVRSREPRFLAVLCAAAAWRERVAQRKNLPRNRVLRDDVLLDVVANRPTTVAKLRELQRVSIDNKGADDLTAAINEAMALSPEECPQVEAPQRLPKGLGPLVDLLRVMLRMTAEEHDVAQRLIANSSELEKLAASDDADVPALRGWRYRLFGERALALKRGELAIKANGRRVEVVDL